ncbi:TonB-dependent receptor [Pedobacter nyackensis]|uniref:TonB-linked outer membrane protein, SusC/RagA family n=1 Tax=Pedobacter nyackensis TaxID=475255 RepID=A0A1W2B9Z2_9SPHI|nr:TonB-dependent receptor [Pedobacter nyackensis]SMC69532.1 TonB-linked outer membrane protein, SusC/RagA family [Pedobacter nyackensis]
MYENFTELTFRNTASCALRSLSMLNPANRISKTDITKWALRMRLIIAFLFLTFLQVNAASYAQKVTINVKNTPIKEVFSLLTKQTGYNFICDASLIKSLRPVTVNLRQVSLKEALNKCFSEKAVEVLFNGDQTIVIREKPIPVTEIHFAAPIPIIGKVTDEKGLPIPGVSVRTKGTSNTVVTDSNGSYKILAADQNDILIFSYVGYTTFEIQVKDTRNIDVTLKEQKNALEEVLVIGYGEQSKKKVSTAISRVDGKFIGVQPVSTPGEALAGLASGVQVQSGRGGYPGEAPTIRIRGIGSLGTDSDPLFVVDGYPLQESTQFNLINPADIESIDLLKDAASAAIYGSRAANGVVIVTTKRGKAGKTSFTVSAYTGVQNVAKKVDLLSRDQFIEYSKYAARMRGITYPTIFNTNPQSLPDVDWQDVIFRQAPISDFQLSARGGSEKVQFSVSGGYFKQDGTMLGTTYDRYNLRFNMDANLSPKLKLGISMAPSFSQQFRQPAGGQFSEASASETTGARALPSPIHSAVLMPPVVPVYAEDGDYAQGYRGLKNSANGVFFQAGLYNPLGVLELYKNRLREYRLLGNNFLEYQPIKDLKFKTSIGATFNLNDQYAYIPATLANGSAPAASLSNPIINQIYAAEAQSTILDWLWENTVSYNKTFGSNHNFNALLLYSLQKFQAKSTKVNGRPGTYTTTLLENPLASSEILGSLAYSQNAFLSLGGRINYDYKGKYILSAALRQDGSSRFGPNNRFALFPSVSGAWRITEESFMKPLKNVLNELKLRASYGETGNANIGDFTWSNNIIDRDYVFGSQKAFGAAQSGFANHNLTWEKNRQTDFGLEAGFLDDKYSISFDYYTRHTEGMLFQKDLPSIIGYATSYRTNLGRLNNHGFELSGKANFRLGDVKWTVDANISANRTMVADLGGPSSLPAKAAIFGWDNVFQVKVGDPLGLMHGYQVEGIFKNTQDLSKYPQWVTGNKVGDWIIKDQNNDGKINEEDMAVIGNGFPDFIYGLSSSFQYKNFDLSLIVQGVQGVNLINGNIRHQFGVHNVNTSPTYYNNMFDSQNPDRDVEYPAPLASGVTPLNNLTNKAVSDASFLRIRNLTLGYTLPAGLLKTIKMQTVRFYATGQNLFTFTKYNWYNPETSVTGDSADRPGVDQGTYPANRVFIFGINVGF